MKQRMNLPVGYFSVWQFITLLHLRSLQCVLILGSIPVSQVIPFVVCRLLQAREPAKGAAHNKLQALCNHVCLHSRHARGASRCHILQTPGGLSHAPSECSRILHKQISGC